MKSPRRSLIRNNQTGLTIIELVVVFLILGILTAIFILSFATIRHNNRNQTRKNDIDSLSKQLETYYVEDNNDRYPTLDQMNSASWLEANLPNLNRSTLRDPASKSYTLVDRPTKNVFAYQVSSVNGEGCNNTTTLCVHYTLTATLENSPQKTYVKSSLN